MAVGGAADVLGRDVVCSKLDVELDDTLLEQPVVGCSSWIANAAG